MLMKRFLLLQILFSFSSNLLTAQNVGIGISQPTSRLQVEGNFLVSSPFIKTNSEPTPGQTYTLVNGNAINLLPGDSVFRIYDPGGPAGNYTNNVTATFNSNPPGNIVGVELVFETMDLGTGDSVLVEIETLNGIDRFLALGNGYSQTGKWVLSVTGFSFRFKSNGDGNNGAGFSLVMRRLYTDNITIQNFSGAAGSLLFFDTQKGALRSGNVNNSTRGNYSTALGLYPTASGSYSIALGAFPVASGGFSTAIGEYARASGTSSIALGERASATANGSVSIGTNSSASASGSFAIGYETISSGTRSIAIGDNTTASGNYSIAIGNFVSTNNVFGSLVIGDRSTTTVMNSSTSNSFRARFDGGYRFYTSSDLTTNAWLPSGSNAWSTSSDIKLKENFAEVDGEDFLKKIAAMKLVSWNYKKQDAAKFRHYGPMAQDFYAAFGKDKYGNIGNDTTINQADFDGVNMIAIQALEKRTATYQQQMNELKITHKKELDELKIIIAALQKELTDLKTKK
jgi:hypothetical protein